MDWIENISDADFEKTNIAKLPDRPNQENAYGRGGMSASDLKAYFDQAAKLLRSKIEALIDATNPENYSGNIKVSFEGIETLKDLVESFEDGSFANKLLVSFGEESLSVESALGSLKESLEAKAEKLDNNSGSPSVYGITASNVPFLIKLLQNPITTGSIPVYLGNENAYDINDAAVLFTGTPTKEKHAANRKYVDGELDKKAEKLDAANSVYAYDSRKKATALAVSSNQPTAIAAYTREEITDSADFVNLINKLNALGRLFVATPEASDATYTDFLCAANKGFVNRFLKTVEINYDGTEGKITFVFKDGNGDEKLKKTIDLPIEKAFTDADYDEENNSIIFTTESGGTVTVPLGLVIGGIITPENLAQDLEGSDDKKAVSQAAVKAAVDDLKDGYEDLSDDVAAHGIALEGKVDKESLYEEWQTANVIDPSLAEEGYYINVDTPEFAPSDGWNNHFRLPKDKAISWGDNTSVYIRTSLPNTSEYSGVQICVIQIDGSGLRVAHNVFSFSNITSAPEGKEYQKKDGATHFVLYTTGRSLGVSFDDWCLSFEPLAKFVAFESGTRIKEGDIIITTPPTEEYHPVPKGYFDKGLARKLNAPDVIPARGNDYVYVKTWDDKYEFKKASPQGNGGEFLQYGAAANIGTAQWTYGQIAVGNPVNPYNAAPKIYVDNKINDLSTSLANLQEAAIGTLYTTVEYSQSGGIAVLIPTNALRYIYVESLGNATFLNSNGEAILTQPVDALSVNENVIVQRSHVPCLVQLPEGAEYIECTFNSGFPEGVEYTSVEDLKIIFQVKVGA